MRRYIVFVLAVLMVLILPQSVHALSQAGERTETVDIASLTYPTTCLFSVGWENGDLFSTLIAPEGTRYPEDVPSKGITIAKREGITIFRVEQAQSGMWRIELTGNASGEVAVLAQKITSPLVVGDITATQLDNNISIRFPITGETGECKYEVSLSLAGQTDAARVLQAGTVNTGESVQLTIPAGDVSTWPEYIVTVHAEMSRNGFTDFDDASSPAFSFTNPNSPAAVTGAKATFLDGRAVLLSWPAQSDITDKWLGALLSDHTILTSSTAAGDSVSLTVPIPDTLTGAFSIQLSRMVNGIAGLPAVFAFESVSTFASITGITLPEATHINEASLALTFRTQGPVSITVTDQNAADAEAVPYNIDGEGICSIPLKEGQNRLVLTADAEDGQSASTEIRLVSDTRPPLLRVMQDWDGIVTDVAVLRFSGNVDRDAAVSVNGLAQEISSLGNFSAEVSLTEGSNRVEVAASDKAGNTVQYVANILRTDAANRAGLSPWFLLLAIPVLLAAAGLIFYFVKTRGKNGPKGKTGSKGFIRIAVCLLVVFLLAVQPSCSLFPVKSQDNNSQAEKATPYRQADAVYTDGVIEAVALYLDGSPMKALDLLHLVLRDLPDDVQALLALSRLRLIMGDISAAIDGYQELIRRYEGVTGPVTDMEIDLIARWLAADAQSRPAILEEWQNAVNSAWSDLSDSMPARKVDTGSDSVMKEDADLVYSLLDLSGEAVSGNISADELEREVGHALDQLDNRTDSAALAILDTLSMLQVLSDTAPDAWGGESGVFTDSLAGSLSEDNPNIDLSDTTRDDTDTSGELSGFGDAGPEDAVQTDGGKPDKPDDGTTDPAGDSDSQTSSESSGGTQGSLDLPAGLDGTLIRTDLTGLFNVCALELTTPGRIRMFMTVAEGAQGFSGGTPAASDFELRTNLGFRYLLDLQQASPVTNIERYTILLIDRRPEVSADNLALEKAAAAAYINSMAEGEKALVISGGIPGAYSDYASPSESVQLFGNMEMETYLPTSDKSILLEAVNSAYGGDAFDNPDMVHMLSYPLSVMTSISPVEGDWNTFQLSSATPRFGQIIAFTDGNSGEGVSAGGPKSIDFLRGAAITANAAIHIVSVGDSADDDYLAGLAAAGRGSYIKASRDSLADFYSFVRSRGVSVFLLEAAISGSPENEFFELWCHRTADDTYAGYKHNAGAGVDLVGTAQYSDSALGPGLFQDYTGDETDGSIGPDGGDPFESTDGETQTDGTGTETDGTDSGNEGTDTGAGDGTGSLEGQDIVIDTLDRHSIARGSTGLVMIKLSGQGFSDLSPQQVRLYVPELSRYISKDYIAIASDTEIRFFLSSSMAAGTYSLHVTIGTANKNFANTFYVYDAASAASITFGPYTLTGSGLARGDSDTIWNMTNTTINGYIRFDGDTQIDGDWLFGTPDDLTLTPSDTAYVMFDPDSDDFFVNAFYLDDGDTMPLGYLQAFDLHRDGSGTPWVEQPASGGYIPQGVNFGFINIPFNLSTLYPDRIEMPVISLDLKLPMQQYILNKTGGINFAATMSSTLTVRPDALDLVFKASIESPTKLTNVKFFSGMDIKKLAIDIDTSVNKVGVDSEVKLIQGKEYKAHLVMKGWLPDEIGLSIGVSIPILTVPPSPIDVNLKELGGGVEGLAAVLVDPSEILGMTVYATARFTSGDIKMLVPFLSPILSFAGDPPPLLATDNTKLSLRTWPFSLTFRTDLKLFDAFPMGQAELGIGYYSFEQDLLGISDTAAVGLHALLSIGPDIDLKFVRLGYTSGPSIDINNHGLFIAANGGAWAGINLGIVSFTADFTGTFLVAIHDIEGSSYPQLSIILNAVPDAAIVGLWDTDTELDIRLLVNENGVDLVGIPSLLYETLEWLGDQAANAADETWEAVTDGMDDLADLAGQTWSLAEDGYDFADETGDDVINILTDGYGAAADTASDLIDYVDDVLPDPPTFSGTGSAIQGAWHSFWNDD